MRTTKIIVVFVLGAAAFVLHGNSKITQSQIISQDFSSGEMHLLVTNDMPNTRILWRTEDFRDWTPVVTNEFAQYWFVDTNPPPAKAFYRIEDIPYDTPAPMPPPALRASGLDWATWEFIRRPSLLQPGL